MRNEKCKKQQADDDNDNNNTGTSFLGGEFKNKDRNSESVNSFGSDKEVIVIVDDQTDDDKSGNGGNGGDEGFDFGRLTTEPCMQRLNRLFHCVASIRKVVVTCMNAKFLFLRRIGNY